METKLEPTTIKLLADAAAALLAAKQETSNGFVADHCQNALRIVEKALNIVTTIPPEEE